MARELSLSGNKGERMTQLPDMSSLRTRGLDAALRAIGFVLWFSFILFCVGLNQSHWACLCGRRLFCHCREVSGKRPRICHDVPSFYLKKLRILSYSIRMRRSGPTLIVPCAIAFKIFGKNEVLPGLTAILIWGSVLTLVLARISRRIDGLSFLLGVSVMCAAFLGTFSFHFGHVVFFSRRNCRRCLPYPRTLAHIKRAIRGDIVISVRSRAWVRVPVEISRRNPRDGHCPGVCCERHACWLPACPVG